MNMKRIFIILAAAVCFTFAASSCYQDDIDDLQAAIDELTDSSVASISDQIASIESSISALETLCSNLDMYISVLEDQASSLASSLSETDARISSISEELSELLSGVDSDQSSVSDEVRTQLVNDKAELLASLEALRTSLSTQLETLNSTISTLSSRADDFESRISTLEALASTLTAYGKNAVDTAVTDYETWAEATFLTLEQYYDLSDSVATLYTSIESLNNNLDALADSISSQLLSEVEDKVTEIVETYLAQYGDSLITASIESAFSELETSYKTAIADAKEEITSAYTTAIETGISELKESLTTWVNEQLAGYYTLAQTDAQLSALKDSLTSQLAIDKAYIETLISSLTGEYTTNEALLEALTTKRDSIYALATASDEQIADLCDELDSLKSVIADAYNAAIEEAITDREGKISSAMDEINATIESEIAAVNQTISALEESISALEVRATTAESTLSEIQATITELMNRIQSFTYVPTYNDGAVSAYFSYGKFKAIEARDFTIDFKVRPADVADSLAALWETALSAKVTYPSTRSSVEFDELEITGAEADENGILSITISGDAMSEDVLTGALSAYLCVEISDGVNIRASDYLKVTGQEYMPIPDYVEIGGIKWATWNVGAASPEESGVFYSWALVDPLYYYSSANNPYYQVLFSTFNGSAYIGGLSDYDPATNHYGADWAMPSYDDIKALAGHAWANDTLNDVVGWSVSDTNDVTKSIFFPKTGYLNNGSSMTTTRVNVWSGTEYSSTISYFLSRTASTSATTASATRTAGYRYYGMPVRAIYVGDSDEE